jgi:hypothetical protein
VEKASEASYSQEPPGAQSVGGEHVQSVGCGGHLTSRSYLTHLPTIATIMVLVSVASATKLRVPVSALYNSPKKILSRVRKSPECMRYMGPEYDKICAANEPNGACTHAARQ